MDFDREKVVASFLAESQEGLERSEQYLIAAETEPGGAEPRQITLRASWWVRQIRFLFPTSF